MKNLGTIGFRNREAWEAKTFFRKDDRVRFGRGWVYATSDHTSSEDFNADMAAGLWDWLVDASGLEDMEQALSATKEATTAAEEATTEAKDATEATKEVAAEAREAVDVLTKNISPFENDEFIYGIADLEGNLLFGIRRDGSCYQPKGIPEETAQALAGIHSLHPMENDDYLFAICDGENNVLFGITRNGGSMVNSISGVCTVEQFESKEFVYAVLDSVGNLLFGVKTDGTFYMSKYSLPAEILEQIKNLNQWLKEDEGDMEFLYKIQDKDGNVLFGLNYNGSVYMPKGIPEEQKVINKRTEGKLSDLERALANFTGGTGDWSDAGSMRIPIPRCAMLNILSDTMPTAKSGMGTSGVNCDIPCQWEFWDRQGNYAKIWVLMSAQGNSSMGFTKKNLAADLFASHADMMNDGDTFEIKFGDWVPQDSFHLKAYYTDTFRGVCACSYSLYEEMALTRGMKDNRPYKEAFMDRFTMSEQGVDSVTDIEENFDTGAKCFPQGFPVIVYQNGEFYGVYSWQLKKHRDNMHQNKKTAEHVHLDGTLGAASIFGGTIDWKQFEVRNPKDLYMQEYQTIRGEETLEYNGDYPREIMGKDSEHYDSKDKAMKRCAQSKQYIIDLSGRMAELKAAETTYGATTIQSEYNKLITNHTHTSSTGLNALTSIAFIGKDEWLVYLTKDDTNTNDATLINWLNSRYAAAMAVEGFAAKGVAETDTTHCVKVWDNGAYVDSSVWEALLAEAGLAGYTLDFNGSTGKVYPTGNAISLAPATDSRCYLKIVNLHELITAMETYMAEVNVQMRELIGRYFKVSFMVDYILETNLVQDGDGYNKNWQWTTWDGVQWVANPYDHDGIFGAYHVGNYVSNPSSGWLGNTTTIPTGWIIKYFLPEMQARYAQLRNLGIFEAEHVAGIVMDWLMRIGADNMEAEYERWPESPCYRDSLINAAYWRRSTGYTTAWSAATTYAKNGIAHKNARIFKSLVAGNIGNDPTTDDGTLWEDVTFNPEKEYAVNDVCYYGSTSFFGFTCLAACVGEAPLTGFYTLYPKELGHYDSVYRVRNWVEKRIEYMDKLLSYSAPANLSAASVINETTIDAIINK